MHNNNRSAQRAADMVNRHFPGAVTTADKIKRPPPKPRDPDAPNLEAIVPKPKERERWSKEKRHAFDVLSPHAVYLAAAQQRVAVTVWDNTNDTATYFGGNRGLWLVKVGTTTSLRDNVTSLIDKDPFVRIKVERRIWTLDHMAASQLAFATVNMIAEAAEEYGYETKLLHGFQDVGPTLDMTLFEQQVVDVAGRQRLMTWTEEELSDLLNRCLKRAADEGLSPYERLAFEQLVDTTAMEDMQRRWRR